MVEPTNNGNVWVEKWRPTNFDGIVLDPLNKQILKNIINTSYFPNLLFYGPPGTGKTTTIINLVNAYQEVLNQKHKGLNLLYFLNLLLIIYLKMLNCLLKDYH